MEKMTRRAMLWATSTGVAALAGVAALVSTKSHAQAEGATASTTGVTATGPITAFISDASSGKISVFQGEREIVVNAPDLVRALANITR